MQNNELVQATCPQEGCGITFGLEAGYVDRRRSDHRRFYCPNGHEQLFPQQTKEERLQQKLEQEQLEHLHTMQAKQKLERELKKYKPKVSKKKK